MNKTVNWDPPISLEPLKERKSLHEFQEAVERKLEKSPGGAIAVFNMRQFKYINESYGREKGDQLLASGAKRENCSTGLAVMSFTCSSTGGTGTMSGSGWKAT